MDLLTVILDLNPMAWASKYKEDQKQVLIDQNAINSTKDTSNSSSNSPFHQFTNDLCIFLSSFMLLNKSNHLAIIAMTHQNVKYIYPPTATATSTPQSTSHDVNGNTNQTTTNKSATDLNHHIHTGIQSLLSETKEQTTMDNHESTSDDTQNTNFQSLLSAAFSLALLYTKQVQIQFPKIKSRILITALSDLTLTHLQKLAPNQQTQNLSLMNCIFAAQKRQIVIDTCVLTTDFYSKKSSDFNNNNNDNNNDNLDLEDYNTLRAKYDNIFLQQACQMTCGIYLLVSNDRFPCLLQYLLQLFLPELMSRKYLVQPIQHSIDYRATCSCHSNIIDIGNVCPVCLSIFCKQQSKCDVCATRFPFTGNNRPLVKQQSKQQQQQIKVKLEPT